MATCSSVLVTQSHEPEAVLVLDCDHRISGMRPRIIPVGSRFRTLVVEDEPVLGESAADTVEDAGFKAVEAADAVEAVAVSESRPDISVVFTDVGMPHGVDGLKLVDLHQRPLGPDGHHRARQAVFEDGQPSQTAPFPPSLSPVRDFAAKGRMDVVSAAR